MTPSMEMCPSTMKFLAVATNCQAVGKSPQVLSPSRLLKWAALRRRMTLSSPAPIPPLLWPSRRVGISWDPTESPKGSLPRLRPFVLSSGSWRGLFFCVSSCALDLLVVPVVLWFIPVCPRALLSPFSISLLFFGFLFSFGSLNVQSVNACCHCDCAHSKIWIDAHFLLTAPDLYIISFVLCQMSIFFVEYILFLFSIIKNVFHPENLRAIYCIISQTTTAKNEWCEYNYTLMPLTTRYSSSNR